MDATELNCAIELSDLTETDFEPPIDEGDFDDIR
jgi:hypothetical protein